MKPRDLILNILTVIFVTVVSTNFNLILENIGANADHATKNHSNLSKSTLNIHMYSYPV